MSEVTGQVFMIEPTKLIGQKGFKKRTVVIEQKGERFTNYLPMEFVGDKCDQADSLQVGDTVRAIYRLTGRKWQKDDASEVRFFLGAEIVSHEVTVKAQPQAAIDLDTVPF